MSRKFLTWLRNLFNTTANPASGAAESGLQPGTEAEAPALSSLLKVGYFHAPIMDLADYSPDPGPCSVCGKMAAGRVLYRYQTEAQSCLNCLVKGKGQFIHDTERGSISTSSRTLPGFPEPVNAELPQEQVRKMFQTPYFNSLLGSVWQYHCEDFMTFIGNWSPRDFSNHSESKSGEQLFKELVPEECHELWDDLEPNDQSTQWREQFYFHAFRCEGCQHISGYEEIYW